MGAPGTAPGAPEERRPLDELRVLHEIGKALTGTLELEGVLRLILTKISEWIRPDTWSLLLREPGSRELRFAIAVGARAAELQGLCLAPGEGIAGWVASNGRALLVPDVSRDPRWSPRADEQTRFRTRSVVCVPLLSRGEMLGVIELLNMTETRGFDERDLEVLSSFADYAAIAIENARAVERITELSLRDDLSGLYNTRHLLARLDQLCASFAESGEALALLFLDLDHFKRVNDTFGHLIGSNLLRAIGHLIAASLEEGWEAARYGGDEYVILMPGAGEAAALRFAEELRCAIAACPIPAEGADQVHVSASIGLACWSGAVVDAMDLLRRADQAMYRVKAGGRNGVAQA